MTVKVRAGLQVLFGLVVVAMTALAIGTSLRSDLFHLPAAVVNEPWFQATLVDFYFNIMIISAWVIYKEARLWKAVAWIIGFICLGSIATAFYVLWQLNKLKAGEGMDKLLLKRE